MDLAQLSLTCPSPHLKNFPFASAKLFEIFLVKNASLGYLNNSNVLNIIQHKRLSETMKPAGLQVQLYHYLSPCVSFGAPYVLHMNVP